MVSFTHHILLQASNHHFYKELFNSNPNKKAKKVIYDLSKTFNLSIDPKTCTLNTTSSLKPKTCIITETLYFLH